MKAFERMAAQGDVMFIKQPASFRIPEGYKPIPAEKGKYIVAHSETGHHHTVLERGVAYFQDPNDAFTALMEVKEITEVKHEREYHTHEPLLLTPGIYQIRRQREYSPEGYRRVQD